MRKWLRETWAKWGHVDSLFGLWDRLPGWIKTPLRHYLVAPGIGVAMAVWSVLDALPLPLAITIGLACLVFVLNLQENLARKHAAREDDALDIGAIASAVLEEIARQEQQAKTAKFVEFAGPDWRDKSARTYIQNKTPEQLIGIYSGRTTMADADRIAEKYLGKWIRVHGYVSQVKEAPKQWLTVVSVRTEEEPPQSPPRMIGAAFWGPDSRTVTHYEIGDSIHFEGRVTKIEWNSLTLALCALVDGQVSTQ